MDLPKIIGLCGYPLHGKSTAQRFLSELGVLPLDDSQELRWRVAVDYDLSWEDVSAQQGKAKIVPGIDGKMMTVRELIGEYGEINGEARHGPNFWVDMAIEQLRDRRVEQPVSFGSLRRTQAAAVKAAGGLVIAIQDRRKPMSTHYFDEYDYDPVDVMIFNDGTPGDLAWMLFRETVDYLQPSVDQIRAIARHF